MMKRHFIFLASIDSMRPDSPSAQKDKSLERPFDHTCALFKANVLIIYTCTEHPLLKFIYNNAKQETEV